MILNVAQDLNDATYVRCDYAPCSKIARCRTREQNGQTQILPPLGWVIPRRTGEVVNPGVQSSAYCCIEHECRADGIEDPVWDNIAEIPEHLVKVDQSALKALDDSGILPGHQPRRMVDARR
jgi:hypothetical protein